MSDTQFSVNHKATSGVLEFDFTGGKLSPLYKFFPKKINH